VNDDFKTIDGWLPNHQPKWETQRQKTWNAESGAKPHIWEVKMAGKGAVPKERVLNCMPLDDFANYLRARSKRRRDTGFIVLH
jgi:hypothetical protein